MRKGEKSKREREREREIERGSEITELDSCSETQEKGSRIRRTYMYTGVVDHSP